MSSRSDIGGVVQEGGVDPGNLTAMNASEGGRRKGAASDALSWLVGISIVLAAASAVLAAVSDRVEIVRLAVILAIWAFAIGGFATVRARRETKLAENKRDEARLTYSWNCSER